MIRLTFNFYGNEVSVGNEHPYKRELLITYQVKHLGHLRRQKKKPVNKLLLSQYEYYIKIKRGESSPANKTERECNDKTQGERMNSLLI